MEALVVEASLASVQQQEAAVSQVSFNGASFSELVTLASRNFTTWYRLAYIFIVKSYKFKHGDICYDCLVV